MEDMTSARGRRALRAMVMDGPALASGPKLGPRLKLSRLKVWRAGLVMTGDIRMSCGPVEVDGVPKSGQLQS